MEYHGKLYGHLGGKMYFDTSKTTDDFDELDRKAKLYDEIKAKIEGYYKHNNQFFSNGLCEIVGEDIIKSFGYETNCL